MAEIEPRQLSSVRQAAEQITRPLHFRLFGIREATGKPPGGLHVSNDVYDDVLENISKAEIRFRFVVVAEEFKAGVLRRARYTR